jgi:ectoine hydroxylase-related dioxygenase (phytanoyl-CoA dioxygenase family)
MDPEESDSRFSNIRERKHRWDFKLGESAIVRDALRQILSNNDFLKTVLAPLCQCTTDQIENVVLAELGSLVSEPGANHQEWHADTAHTGPTEPDCICCFITLQETPDSMGPTQLIPHTHLEDFHTMALSNFPPKGLMPTSLQPKSMKNGFSSVGDALLMDCRTYHRGSANTYQVEEGTDPNQGKRVVFYFTVRSSQKPRPGGLLFTILKELDERPLIDFLRDYKETVPC